jgi:V/A-type H+/Na+-transporting ATPase subunit F
MSMRKKIAMIGDKDSILGFKALGISVYPVVDVNEATSVLRKASSGDYAIIYIAEHFAQGMKEIISELQQVTLPAITIIPDHRRNLGLAMDKLKTIMEKAVGVDILFKGEGKENE